MTVDQRQFHNVLLVRTDRIGDVVLSLPMITLLRSHLPRARLSMLLREYTRELAEGHEGIDGILTYDRQGEPKPFFRLLSELRSQRFDLVVVAHPTVRLGLLLFFAGIPVRVGSGFRWYSFFFNRKVFEHRRTAEKHEAEYNLSLLRSIGCPWSAVLAPTLAPGRSAEMAAKKVRDEFDLRDSESVAVLHPGSGGSARDWSPQNFGALAKLLHAEGIRVVVTGIAQEENLVQTVVEGSGWVAIPLIGRLSLMELAAFLRSAALFVSNSTGPLHIAAAVGVPVIAFYPPIRECGPKRWGPLTRKKIVFVADNRACARCRGGACQGNDCMDQITVEQVLHAARGLIAAFRERPVHRASI
jgi:lipopolysaccharide heptosyltransferase II